MEKLIAINLANFWDKVNPYEYSNAFESDDEAIETFVDMLQNGGAWSIVADLKDMLTELQYDNEWFAKEIKICKKLIREVSEYC